MIHRSCLVLSLVLVVGCGSSGTPLGPDGSVPDAGGPVCGRPGRTGVTPCAFSPSETCSPGQYCDSMTLACVAGCTSDESCPGDEECVRAAGAAIGVCTACPRCGDGSCTGGETPASCPSDCGTGAVCGDGACSGGETPASCPVDCASGPVCGDGACTGGETAASCPVDCASGPVCGDGVCTGGETPASCPADCASGPVCGDGVCAVGETWAGCPSDCGYLGLDECFDVCDSFEFFDCVESAAACAAACVAATPPQRNAFVHCAVVVNCTTYGACLPLLSS